MGTTSCQMTIISWIFFFITLQKTKVHNLILAFVLSGLLKKSLLFLFKKRKLSTCNKTVHSNYLISMFFLHASWWKGMGCQRCNFSVFHLVQKKHPVFALSSPAWVYMASEFCPWGTEITHFSICCSPTSVLSAGIMAPMHLHWK